MKGWEEKSWNLKLTWPNGPLCFGVKIRVWIEGCLHWWLTSTGLGVRGTEHTNGHYLSVGLLEASK